MMLAPWVLLPVILALRGDPDGSLRVLAARSAVAVALMGAVNAVATLTGCLAAVHLVGRAPARTGGGGGSPAWWPCARLLAITVVGRRAAAARPDQPAVPGLHRVLGRHHAVAVADRGAARHRQLDPVRRAQRDRRLVAGHRLGRGVGHHPGGRGGLAGLSHADHARTGPADRHAAGRWSLLAVGYSGGLGSPIAHQVQAFLDGAGTPLRNVHKLEPLIRLPLILGLAHLLGRIPLPGSVPRPVGCRLSHTPNTTSGRGGHRAVGRPDGGTSLAWTGRLPPPGAFTRDPVVLA